MPSKKPAAQKAKKSNADRRRSIRFDTSIQVAIRFMADGTPIEGAAVEIGPNGMRLVTAMPLVEASYVHISFKSASNDTFCEGRVVWTRQVEDQEQFESGIDIQRWGGGVPEPKAADDIGTMAPKKDRRKKPRD